MNRLWAPWRKTYIRPEGQVKKGCLFCRLSKSRQIRQDYILKQNLTCFAVLNLYPYTNGHILIVPNRHVKDLQDLSPEERLDWLSLADELIRALNIKMHPQGLNMGVNLGKAGGAGIPDHIHFHIVPRWRGDHNFMPVIASSRVISESLGSVYTNLLTVLKSFPVKQVATSKKKSSRRKIKS